MVDKDRRCYFEGKGGNDRTVKIGKCPTSCAISAMKPSMKPFDNTRPYVWYVVLDMPESRDMHRPGQATT